MEYRLLGRSGLKVSAISMGTMTIGRNKSGPIGSVGRALKKFVANAFVVRSRNPGEDGKDLRTVRTVRRYDPTTTWVQFLWLTVRDGLMAGIKE